MDYAEEFLSCGITESPRAESKWLVAHVLSYSRAELIANSDGVIEREAVDQLESLLDRRKRGEPLQYITGSTTFYDSEILVGPGAFIPRPETERLVDVALEHHRASGGILDLCTGTGAILFSLSKEISVRPPMVGVDSSEEALRWAKLNSDRFGTSHIEFLHGDLFSPVEGRQFEMITANPPYVSPEEFQELPSCVKDYEPAEALLANRQGLSVLTRIAESAQKYLVENGWLICEIGEAQGAKVTKTFTKNKWQNVRVVKDYNARDRIVMGQKRFN